MTAEQRHKLGFKDTKALLDHARTNCRALYLCRHAATASKHWEVNQHHDPNVQTVVTHEDGWRIVFVDDNKRTAADQVFDEALNFWTNFIYRNEIAKWKCTRCLDTYWVCKAHDDRPWDGEKACGCGAPGAPCPSCNVSNADNPPRLLPGFQPDESLDE